MIPHTPPPDPDLARLFEAEHDADDVVPSGMRDRLADRLGSLLDVPTSGPGGDGGSDASSAGRGAPPRSDSIAPLLRGLGLVGLGAAASALVLALVVPPKVEVRYVDRIVEIEAGTPPVAPPSAIPAPSARPEVPSRAPSAPTVRSDEALARERALVDTARAAVLRGDGAAAVAAAEKHVRAFPSGQLAEEREALYVRALVLAGREEEARARAARFKRMYPSSVLLPVVDAALSKKP